MDPSYLFFFQAEDGIRDVAVTGVQTCALPILAERFSEMENSSVPSKVTLEERLKEYPELKAKIETLLGIIENAGGDIEKAAEAERRIIEELRQMGNEVLHGWARRQQEKKRTRIQR